VLGYYTGPDPEDGFGKLHRLTADMRKALPRDVHKKSIIPLPYPITPDQLEW
ncbi:N(alpha)-acetyltransferase 20, NatB catalytic subunit, partial [Kappamyces sp. JEL0680]